MSELTANDPPFPTIALLLRHSRAIRLGASAFVLAILLWLAFRTGWVELAVLAPFAALAVHFTVSVAIDVVSLVAETLMPR